MTPNADERLIREFILQLKLGRTRLRLFPEKIWRGCPQAFRPAVADDSRLGIWRSRRRCDVLNREGLLQVDRLLHEFFLPEHRNARYA